MNERTKCLLRKTVSSMPSIVKKSLTKYKVNQYMNCLMSDKEIDLCYSDYNIRDSIIEKYKKKYPRQVTLIKAQMKEMFPRYKAYQEMPLEMKEDLKKDATFCWFAYGFIVHEYVFLDLWGINRDPARRNKLVSDAERAAFRFSANDFSETVYSDKVSAYEKLKSYYKRDVVAVRGKNDLPKLKDFISKHKVFIEKIARSSRGAGVNLVDLTLGGEEQYLDSIVDKGLLLLEEVIQQADELAKFNESSVNTVRLSTFYTKHGIVVPYGFFRTGRQGSFVDNCAVGGVFSTIDTDSGILISSGCTEFGDRFDRHPDSLVTMDGYHLPNWNEAVELCKEVALLTPNLKYLSWDLAFTDKYGWDIVEVNTSGQFLQQAGNLEGIRDTLKPIIDDMDLIIPFTIRG